jgi:hypothetical protein
MQLEMDNEKQNPSARNLQGKGEVELLIESTVDQKREMGNKGSKEGGQQTKVQDKIPSEGLLGKMLKYWDESPHINRKKKQRIVKYCCFIWTQELILKPLVF